MRAVLSVPLVLTTIFLAADAGLRQQDEIGIGAAENNSPQASIGVGTSSVTNTVGLVPRPVFVTATECYSCVGCTDVDSYTEVKACPYTGDKSRQNKCVSFIEKYANMERPWYIRGCASERSSCSEVQKAYALHTDIVKLVSCSECEGDRCNKSSLSHSLSFVSIAFFIIIVPLLTKCTLS